MVAFSLSSAWRTVGPWSLAQAAEPAVKQLEPSMRARVLAALAAFAILGFSLMLLAWLGSRATRRYMRSGKNLSQPTNLDEDDWSKKSLHRD